MFANILFLYKNWKSELNIDCFFVFIYKLDLIEILSLLIIHLLHLTKFLEDLCKKYDIASYQLFSFFLAMMTKEMGERRCYIAIFSEFLIS